MIWNDLHSQSQAVQAIASRLASYESLLNGLLTALEALAGQVTELADQAKRIADAITPPTPQPNDLRMKPTFEDVSMSKCKVQLRKGKGMQASGPPIKWSAASAAGALEFEVLGDDGNPLSPQPTVDIVTTTLGLNDTTKVQVSSKIDELHYNLHKDSGGGSVVLSGTLNYNDGSFGPFSATQELLLDVTSPADLRIKFTPN